MSDSGYLKCSCSHCQGHLEFPVHAIGITTTCPHCGVETTLTAPAGTAVPPPPPPPPRPPGLPPAPQPPPLTAVAPAVAATPPPVSASMTLVDAASAGSKLKKALNVVWSVLVGLAVLAFIGLKVWNKFRRAGNTVEAVKGESNPEQSRPASGPSMPAPKPAPVVVPTSEVLAEGAPPSRKPGDDLQLLSFEVQKARDGNLQYIVGVVTNHSAKQYFNVKLTFDLTRRGGKTGDIATDTLRNLPANVGSTFKVNIIGTTPVASATLARLEGEKE